VLHQLFRLIAGWFMGMLRSMVKIAGANIFVTCFAFIIFFTPDEFNLHDNPRQSKMVRRVLAKLCYHGDQFLSFLLRCLEHPLSKPMVKFKKVRKTVKSYRYKASRHRHFAMVKALFIVASASARQGLNHMHFDSESAPIRVDNCCSRCITNDVLDMVPSSIKSTSKVVRGFKGEECAATCRGTIRWVWDDDMGVKTVFLIPNSYFVPQAVAKLLCPQHWAQEAADHAPIQHGTGCDTNDTSVTLYWDQRSKTRTVPLDPSINVGIIFSTSGYAISDAQCASIEASMLEYGVLNCEDVGIQSDDEDSPPPDGYQDNQDAPISSARPNGEDTDHILFDLDGPEGPNHGAINIDEENH